MSSKASGSGDRAMRRGARAGRLIVEGSTAVRDGTPGMASSANVASGSRTRPRTSASPFVGGRKSSPGEYQFQIRPLDHVRSDRRHCGWIYPAAHPIARFKADHISHLTVTCPLLYRPYLVGPLKSCPISAGRRVSLIRPLQPSQRPRQLSPPPHAHARGPLHLDAILLSRLQHPRP